MRRVIKADSGTERYVEWARLKALQLSALAADLGLESMPKAFQVGSSTIFVRAFADGGYFVRITGGAASGRNFVTSVGSPLVAVPQRWFLASDGRLSEYEEGDTADVFDSLAASTSMDMRTLAYVTDLAIGDGKLRAVRRLRAGQTIAAARVAAGGAGLVADHAMLNRRPNTDHDAIGGVDRVWHRGGMWLSAGGEDIYSAQGVPSGTTGSLTPALWRLSAAQLAQESLPRAEWTGPTDFQLALSGVPQPIRDFYASLPVAHVASGDDFLVSVPAFGGDPAFTTAARHAADAPKMLRMWPMYDYFADAPLVFASMRHATGLTQLVSGGSNFTLIDVSERWALWRLDASTLLWAEVFSTTFAATAIAGSASVRLPAHPRQLGESQASGTSDSHDLASGPWEVCPGLGSDPQVLWIESNAVRAAPTFVTPVSVAEGALTFAAAPQRLMRNGAMIAELPLQQAQKGAGAAPGVSTTSVRINAAAPSGILYDNLWDGTGAAPTAPQAAFWLVLVAGSWQHVQLGLRGSASPSGLPNTEVVWLSPSGTELWTAELGSFGGDESFRFRRDGAVLAEFPIAVPAAAADHLAPPAQGFWYVKSLLGWSYEDPHRFKVRAYTHSRAAGAGFDWVTEDVEVEWSGSSLRVAATPSAAPFLLPSRGTLTEAVPGAAPLPFAGARADGDFSSTPLVPDGYIPHKL